MAPQILIFNTPDVDAPRGAPNPFAVFADSFGLGVDIHYSPIYFLPYAQKELHTSGIQLGYRTLWRRLRQFQGVVISRYTILNMLCPL